MPQVVTEEDLHQMIALNADLLDAIEDGYRALDEGRVNLPGILRMDIPGVSGEVDVKTAYVAGWDSFAVKVSTGFFKNPDLGIPSGNGFVSLLNSQTGQILAMFLDNGFLTTLRTAAAGAIAARVLAPSQVQNFGVIGAGTQAYWQTRAFLLVRKPEMIMIWARNGERAHALAASLTAEFAIPTTVVDDVDIVIASSDAVVTCTPMTRPSVHADAVHSGLHITAVGSDAPTKQELESGVLEPADLIVCDLERQCVELGECRQADVDGVFDRTRRPIELGSILRGVSKGRTNNDQITVCDLTGVGVQDTAIARYVCRQLLHQNRDKAISSA
jgi:ornithine cyclodeaminase